MFSLFKIMLTISYANTVTLCDLFECPQKCSVHVLIHALLNDSLDKVLCRMLKSPIFATLHEVLFLENKILQMQRKY